MAIVSYGGSLQVDISSVYTSVGDVLSINGPQMDTPQLDVTHLNSPNYTRQYLPGMTEPGQVDVEIWYTTAQAIILFGFFRVTKSWRINFSNGSKWDFSGHISTFTTNQAVDTATMNFSIKVTGAPTLTA
jgi:hypothetical protein